VDRFLGTEEVREDLAVTAIDLCGGDEQQGQRRQHREDADDERYSLVDLDRQRAQRTGAERDHHG
jgi:hypothetical protein